MGRPEGRQAGGGRVRIRPLAPRDVPGVAALERVCFGAEAWPPEAFRELLRAFRSRPSRGAFWVAEESGTGALLGYVGMEVSALRGEADLINIAVGPEARRRGIGRVLAGRVLRHCRRLCVELLWLRVRASNRGARRFYRLLGFTERGRFAGYYLDPEEAAIIMAVELTPPAG